MRWHLATIERYEVKVSTEATNRYPRAFTAVTVNCNAGNTLKRFCEVGVREVTDVFRSDRVNDTRRVAFCVHRTLKA